MRTLIIPAILTLLTLAPLVPAQAQQTADLRPRLTAGRTDRFEFRQEGHMTLVVPEVAGVGGEQTITQEMHIALKMDDVTEEEGAFGTVTFERFALTMAGGGADIDFDSDDPKGSDEGNPIAPLLRPMVGKSFQVRFDADGNITEVSGLADVLPAGALGGALRDLLGDKAMKDNIMRITTTGGGAAVRRKGESWTSTDTVNLPEGGGELEMKTTHRLKSIGGEEATVTMTGDLRLKDADASGVKLGQSSFDGRYVWDTETGMLRSLEFDRTVEFEVDRHGVKASVQQDIRTRVKRLDS